jgi:hypothetical protein
MSGNEPGYVNTSSPVSAHLDLSLSCSVFAETAKSDRAVGIAIKQGNLPEVRAGLSDLIMRGKLVLECIFNCSVVHQVQQLHREQAQHPHHGHSPPKASI